MVKKIKRFTHPSENTNNTATEEHWITHTWRPAMAWSYMIICLFDFIIAPSGIAFLITFHSSSIPPWQSLTLSNGGIMHLAFGAILGVSAWGRTKESVINTEASVGYYPGMGGMGNQGQSYNESVYTREEIQVGNQARRNARGDQIPENPPPAAVPVPPTGSMIPKVKPIEELYDDMRGDGTDVPVYKESSLPKQPR